jgi:hypothetical protein
MLASLGLSYGTDYSLSYFSDANAAVLAYTMFSYPDARSFRELASRIAQVLASAKKRALHPQLREAGTHVFSLFTRMADIEMLNATERNCPFDVFDARIDFSNVFSEPQIICFHLPCALGPTTSPHIARMALYSLLAAAKTCRPRKVPVFVVIDEMPRMVSKNLEYVLQTARSMDVGVIFAAQSLHDLKNEHANLIPTVWNNTRLRQVFGVCDPQEMKEIELVSGTCLET